ncbi:MAG: cytochrome c3 family protein [Byssovorax sp.]
MNDLLRPFLSTVACGAAFLATLAIACGPGPEPQSPPSPGTSSPASTSAAASGTSGAFDECAGSKPVPHPFSGILRVARCEQHMYLTMASVAGQLGVKCAYCHAPPKPGEKDEDYPVMTPKKEIANWMSMHLMQAVKPIDGSPIKCRSCHTDEEGKPVAKILGEPRDPVKAAEWMSLVMVAKFVSADGEKLRCKSCHVGNVKSPTWQGKVILRSDQIPRHSVGGAGPAL